MEQYHWYNCSTLQNVMAFQVTDDDYLVAGYYNHYALHIWYIGWQSGRVYIICSEIKSEFEGFICNFADHLRKQAA